LSSAWATIATGSRSAFSSCLRPRLSGIPPPHPGTPRGRQGRARGGNGPAARRVAGDGTPAHQVRRAGRCTAGRREGGRREGGSGGEGRRRDFRRCHAVLHLFRVSLPVLPFSCSIETQFKARGIPWLVALRGLRDGILSLFGKCTRSIVFYRPHGFPSRHHAAPRSSAPTCSVS